MRTTSKELSYHGPDRGLGSSPGESHSVFSRALPGMLMELHFHTAINGVSERLFGPRLAILAKVRLIIISSLYQMGPVEFATWF